MTITFSQTAREVVTGAMRDMGVISLADEPEAEELAYGIEHLNLMMKDLASEGVNPWTDAEATVLFAPGAVTVTLDPRPVNVLEARIVEAPTYQRPLQRWEGGEYDMLPNKAQTGRPLAYEVIQTAKDVQLRLWPVPTSETTIAYSYQRVVEDVAADDPIDVPQVWGDAIRAMLKPRLTAYFPNGEAPQSLLMRAEMLKTQLLDFDRPESYIIEPDQY